MSKSLPFGGDFAYNTIIKNTNTIFTTKLQ